MMVARPHDVPTRLERSMLFVPASNWKMIEKAATLAVDAVCLDLEDSVTPAQKSAARAHVVRAFTEVDFGRRIRMFRMNALDTEFAYRDLVDVVENAAADVDLVMVPKVGAPDDVKFVDKLLAQIELHRGPGKRIGIEAQIETAAGFLYAREIAQASPRLEALIFGPGDYAASMQMPSAGIGTFDDADEHYPGHRWHAVMHTVVAAARAAGLRCVDGPFADYNDGESFARSCRIARVMGFDGKQCIHPSQLEAVNAAFTPSEQEAAAARRLLDACERAAAEHRGAATFDGKMIDAASLRTARGVAERYRLSQEHGTQTSSRGSTDRHD
jgi:citrate lyase beta subunit